MGISSLLTLIIIAAVFLSLNLIAWTATGLHGSLGTLETLNLFYIQM